MKESILKLPNGDCYIERVFSADEIYTDGPYSERVARWLARPLTSVDPAALHLDCAQRALHSSEE